MRERQAPRPREHDARSGPISVTLKTLQGAYVKAWVWVEAEAMEKHGARGQPVVTAQVGSALWEQQQEARARLAAKRLWQDDGEIEVDDNAEVSLSYKEG